MNCRAIWLAIVLGWNLSQMALAAGSKRRPSVSLKSRDLSSKDKETEKKSQPPREASYAALLGINIPHPLDLGIGLLQPKGTSYLLSVGYLNLDVKPGNKAKDIAISLTHIEARYRTEPYERHPIFLQLALGYQQLFLKGTRSTSFGQDQITIQTDVKGKMRVDSLYYTPKVGMIKHLNNGLTLSWGFGFMIPAYVRSSFEATITGDPLIDDLIRELEAYKATKRDLERVGKRVGQVGLPVLDIIELAYRF